MCEPVRTTTPGSTVSVTPAGTTTEPVSVYGLPESDQSVLCCRVPETHVPIPHRVVEAVRLNVSPALSERAASVLTTPINGASECTRTLNTMFWLASCGSRSVHTI